jgi:diacylglycerol kinase family enzyme
MNEPANSPKNHRRIAVVVNGNAKSVTQEVITTLDQILKGGDMFVSRRIEESEDIAKVVVDRGYDTILTGGGDGTFTVMVSAVVREADKRGLPRPRFGLLRLGTGNSLAWVVGASKAKEGGLAADIQRLREDAGSRELHLIDVCDTLTPFCGFGVDAVVLHDYNRTKKLLAKTPLRAFASGPLGYAISCSTQSIPSYIFRAPPHVRVTNLGGEAFRIGEGGAIVGPPIPTGDVIYEGKSQIVGCSTIPYYGFGFRMFPFAEDRANRFQLRLTTINSFTFVSQFPKIWRGEYQNSQSVFDYLVQDIQVDIDPATAFQIGGDPHGFHSQLRIRLQPEPIRLVDFYAPPSG